MTSQGDVEMSVISKNFFFTFFTLFVAFTLIGVASTTYQLSNLMDTLRKRFGDILGVSYVLAQALGTLGPFYMNLIVLQGLGLFPFRLLEFGAVFLYPFGWMGSKTPRGTCSFSTSVSVRLTCLRLCGTGPTSGIQLWLLFAPNSLCIHNLHCL